MSGPGDLAPAAMGLAVQNKNNIINQAVKVSAAQYPWRFIGRHFPFGGSYGSVAGTDIGGTTRKVYTAKGAISSLKLLMGNQIAVTGSNGAAEQDGFNSISLAATVEYPLGTVVDRFSVGGAASWNISSNAPMIESDVLGVYIPDAAQFAIRYYISAPGGRYVFNAQTLANECSNHISSGGNGSDQTGVVGTFTVNGAGVAGVAPFAVIGDCVTQRSVLGIGDSIMAGRGFTQNSLYASAMYNFFDQAFANGEMNIINAAVSGGTLLAWQNPVLGGAGRSRLALKRYATDIFCEMGINDLGYAATWNVVANAQLKEANQAYLQGQHYWLTTVTPYVSSTDNCLTVASQTKNARETKRQAYNLWVRSGCPVDATGIAVTPGTAGSAPSPYISGFVEVAATVEVDATNTPSLTGGYWRVPTAAGITGLVLTGTPTMTALAVSGGLTVYALTGQVVKITSGAAAGQVAVIQSNTASAITLYANGSTAQSGIAVTGLTTAPAAGDTFEVWNVYTNEGLHPALAGHTAMSVPVATWKAAYLL